MSTSTITAGRWTQIALLIQAWLLQLVAFALLLATLVGGSSEYAGGSPLALIAGPDIKSDIGAIVGASSPALGIHAETVAQGACVDGSARICSARFTHPNFTAPYSLARVPEPLLKALPEILPDLPDLLEFVVTMSAVTMIVLSIALLPRCVQSRMAGSRIALYSKALLQANVVFSTVTLVFGITGRLLVLDAHAILVADT